MGEKILVLNAGSSSLKYAVFVLGGEALSVEQKGQSDSILKLLEDKLGGIRFAAIGHRVVHGGSNLIEPTRITPEILAQLKDIVPLAPLHQPRSLEPIELLLERAPGVPQIACFDTAFHSTQPELATLIPLPREIAAAGVKRYGFHGLSYEYIASVLEKHDPSAARGKTIVLHLGNGASICALDAGRSIATTMGFSALDGLVMSTRCGSLDPGVVLYLIDELKLDARRIEKLLYKESGLLAVSGLSGDMRELLASADPRSGLAVDLYIYRIRREIGSLVAALGGLDAIVFTAGVGENSAEIRRRVCSDCSWLGVELDRKANEEKGPRISTQASKVSAWVIPTDEELMIAGQCRRILQGR